MEKHDIVIFKFHFKNMFFLEKLRQKMQNVRIFVESYTIITMLSYTIIIIIKNN